MLWHLGSTIYWEKYIENLKNLKNFYHVPVLLIWELDEPDMTRIRTQQSYSLIQLGSWAENISVNSDLQGATREEEDCWGKVSYTSL